MAKKVIIQQKKNRQQIPNRAWPQGQRKPQRDRLYYICLLLAFNRVPKPGATVTQLKNAVLLAMVEISGSLDPEVPDSFIGVLLPWMKVHGTPQASQIAIVKAVLSAEGSNGQPLPQADVRPALTADNLVFAEAVNANATAADQRASFVVQAQEMAVGQAPNAADIFVKSYDYIAANQGSAPMDMLLGLQSMIYGA